MNEEYSVGYSEGYQAGWNEAIETTPPAAPVQEGRDWPLLEATQESLREHMAEIQRLTALVRAQQITIDKLNAQRQWTGLTDEEIYKIHETQVWDARRSYARAIEAKLREKNT
jgi:hypothetical protein